MTTKHPRLTELHTRYTRTAGPASKLMATAGATTRVVTTLRGLDEDTANGLVDAFNSLDTTLSHLSATPMFTEQVHALGVRTHQISSGASTPPDQATSKDPAPFVTLSLAFLADLPVDDRIRRCTDSRPDTYAVYAIARILTTCEDAPDPVVRAVRGELAGVLASYEGPVVTVAWPTFLDALNVGPWIDTAAASTLEDLLVGDFVEHIHAAEQVVWDLSTDGGPLDRPTPDEVDDLGIGFNLNAVVDRLHARRPGVLVDLIGTLRRDAFLAGDELTESWDLDDDQADALRRALTLTSAAPPTS